MPHKTFPTERRTQPVLHTLLAFCPQHRHPSEIYPALCWDIRHDPSSSALPSSSTLPPNQKPTMKYRSHPATNPPTTFMRVTCGLFPFGWYIDVSASNGYVKVGDVLDAVYRALRLAIRRGEWAATPHVQKARITEAFYSRVNASGRAKYEYTQGVRRVDWMLKHTVFVGLTPSVDQPYTWTLTLKRLDGC